MVDSKLQRVMGSVIVRAMPNDVRKALYADAQFCSEIGIETVSSFPLGGNVAVESVSLFKAIGAAIDGRKSARIKLPNGKEIRAKLGINQRNRAVIQLGKQSFVFHDADLLAASRARRARALARSLKAYPLLADEAALWRERLAKGPLEKNAFVELMTALERTPEALTATVGTTRSLSAEVLVPDDRNYYFRLLAPPPDALGGIRTYTATKLAEARKYLLKTNPAVGLRRIAYSNLWQPLIPFDVLGRVGAAQVATLRDAFDPFSLLFGFELCRARIEDGKSYAALATDFLKALFDDDEVLRRRCQVFTACAVLTTVNLRRTFTESVVPLYWFRLSALTHAGLLTEALRHLARPEEFYDWARKGYGTQFLWYVLYDRRDAPRWRSEWISPEQVEAELFGRVQCAIGSLPRDRWPKAWTEIIDKFFARQQARNQTIASHFPGPFDDFGETPVPPPELQKIIDEVEASLEAAATPSEVPRLTGVAYLSRPTDKIIRELTRLLSLPPAEVLDGEFLDTCAHIAAAGRSEPLARSVVTQCLRAVRNSSSERIASDFYSSIIEACATHADPKAYREFLGESSTSFVLNLPGSIPSKGTRANLEFLTHRDPKLFAALSRASANLEAVEMRRQ